MDAELRRLLDELNQAITESQADGTIDADERAELRRLVARADALLDPEDRDEDDHESIREQLDEAAVRFEGRHPTMAAVIRSAVDTLTGYGI